MAPSRFPSALGLQLTLALLVTLAPMPCSIAADREEPFLPAWHFYQSATTFEAIMQLREASRSIACAVRLEPSNREYRRAQERIYRRHDNASSWGRELSLNLKMGTMQEMVTVSWTLGDDPFAVAQSLAHQLALTESERTLYNLVVSHQVQMNLSLPAWEPPAWMMPPDQVQQFTMKGLARTRRHYIDDSLRRIHDKDGNAKAHEVTWSRLAIELLVRDARASAHKYYGAADSHLFSALRIIADAGGVGGNSMQGKKVAVISVGASTDESSAAWYEAVCLAWGSRSCTSFRPCQALNQSGKGSTRPPVAFQHPLVGSRCLPAGTDGYLGERFDVIVAMNAVHHVGLGRYGEPIKAEADSELLGLLQTMLVADGCILLGIPLHHQDVVVWNAHRLYGPVRLPRLLRPWHLRAAFGVPDKLRTRELFTSACFDRDTFHGAFTKVDDAVGEDAAPLQIVVFYLGKPRAGSAERASAEEPAQQCSELMAACELDEGVQALERGSRVVEQESRPRSSCLCQAFAELLDCLNNRGRQLLAAVDAE